MTEGGKEKEKEKEGGRENRDIIDAQSVGCFSKWPEAADLGHDQVSQELHPDFHRYGRDLNK